MATLISFVDWLVESHPSLQAHPAIQGTLCGFESVSNWEAEEVGAQRAVPRERYSSQM